MWIASEIDARRIGLDEILTLCPVRSPQGAERLNQRRLYVSGEEAQLEEEFQRISQLREACLQRPQEIHQVEAILARFRTLSGTLNQLEARRILDEAQCLEIKRTLSGLQQLRSFDTLLGEAGCALPDLEPAAQLLNPDGKSPLGFYVYSAYFPELAEVRQNKSQLEKRILTAPGEQQKELLEQRLEWVSREKELVQEVLVRLSDQLRGFVEDLRESLSQMADLDFRLARAQLSLTWDAPVPLLTTEDSTELVDAFHPLIRESLEQKGRNFTPQSIRLQPGTTVISGANMGGKSVVLQTVVLCQVLTQMGFCPPCRRMETALYDFIAYTAEQPGDAFRGLSSFGQEALFIRDQVALSRRKRGLVVLDEPCRGTNPEEATAILRGLSQFFPETGSSLLMATHHRIPPKPGIRFYQIRGIRSDFLQLSSPALPESDSQAKTAEDQDLILSIQQQMDYTLIEITGNDPIPTAAIAITEKIGLDPSLVQRIKTLYEEEKWLN